MIQKVPVILASAKRSSYERSGVHSWHSYYAGYSEAFVASAIEYLKLNQSHILLDPWNGSGTTALVASRFQIPTIGSEINPIMNIFSTAKNGVLLRDVGLIKKLLKDLENQGFQFLYKCQEEDPLLDFMSMSLVKGVRSLYTVINSYNYPNISFNSKLLSPITEEEKFFLNPFEAFFKSALFITARKLAGYKGGANPTWIKTLINKPEYNIKDLILEFSDTVDLMVQDLKFSSITKLEVEAMLQLNFESDSRKLNIYNNSIDGIITSPPYLTRIDYAMSTKPEILIVSDPLTLRSIREKTIGAPIIVNKDIQINLLWGESCIELLKQVENHTSKAARSYYFPNMLQYFRDIELSLKEIVRVLKPKSKALIVVQSSYFKEHEINLGKIYTEICKNMGVHSEIVNRVVVRGHMAHVNTKSSIYKSNKVYYEDVVCITK